MSHAQELAKRFAKAINDNVKPPILIGPKWLRHNPAGKPEYQFIGAPKIAKATGKDLGRVIKMLLRSATFDDLGLKVKVTAEGFINLLPAGKSGGAPSAGKKAGSASAKKTDASAAKKDSAGESS